MNASQVFFSSPYRHWTSRNMAGSHDLSYVTNGPRSQNERAQLTHNDDWEVSFVFRLDYLSCMLTIASTILVGRRCWEGWLLATVNSVIMCIIGIKTAQLGLRAIWKTSSVEYL